MGKQGISGKAVKGALKKERLVVHKGDQIVTDQLEALRQQAEQKAEEKEIEWAVAFFQRRLRAGLVKWDVLQRRYERELQKEQEEIAWAGDIFQRRFHAALAKQKAKRLRQEAEQAKIR